MVHNDGKVFVIILISPAKHLQKLDSVRRCRFKPVEIRGLGRILIPPNDRLSFESKTVDLSTAQIGRQAEKMCRTPDDMGVRVVWIFEQCRDFELQESRTQSLNRIVEAECHVDVLMSCPVRELQYAVRGEGQIEEVSQISLGLDQRDLVTVNFALKSFDIVRLGCGEDEFIAPSSEDPREGNSKWNVSLSSDVEPKLQMMFPLPLS